MPNSTSTSSAKGATCWRVTLERSSTRRSLPAISAASRNKGRLRCGARGGDVGGAGHERHDAVGQRLGSVELVRREEHGRARGDGPVDQLVEAVAALPVEP